MNDTNENVCPSTMAVAALRCERDALQVEYESRVHWIATMNTIIGYNNDDGFHSVPSPHDIAKRLIEERDQLRAENEALKADKERWDALGMAAWSLQYNSRILKWTVQRQTQTVGNIGQGDNPRQAIDAARAIK